MKNWFQSNSNLLLVCFAVISLSAVIVSINRGAVNTEQEARHLQPSPSHPLPQLLHDKDLSHLFTYYPDPQKTISHNPNEVTIIATGDIIPARSVNSITVNRNDFTYPYHNIAPLLETGDITFINLESPLLPGCSPTIEGMIFCGSNRSIEGLTYSGIDIANIANNHAGNYGISGINTTKKILADANIQVSGSGSPVIMKVKGITFGFLGYNSIGAPEAGISWVDTETIKKQITELKQKNVQYIIVSFHWSREYTHDPDSSQRELAHLAIDSGADLIIGNHPHWVQGVERYNKGYITYAHGNTIFDQMWSQETREGVIGLYTVSKAGLIDVKYFPTIIENYSQPRFATETEAKKILDDMKDHSFKND